MEYYTIEELANATEQLLKEDKHIWAISDDPKCPPLIAERMIEMKNIYLNNIVTHN